MSVGSLHQDMTVMALRLAKIGPQKDYCDVQREVLCPKCGYWLHLSVDDGGVGDECATTLTQRHLEVCDGNAIQTEKWVENWLSAQSKKTREAPRG